MRSHPGHQCAARKRTERGFLNIPEPTVVALLLPGKEEEWRHYVQEVVDSENGPLPFGKSSS